MPNYLVMIYDNEAEWAAEDESSAGALMREHEAFGQRNAQTLRGGGHLADSSTATSIRKAIDGSFSVTDGTFAETKEVLAGYYVVEADDLDQALAIAKQVPAPFGGLEVRPLLEH